MGGRGQREPSASQCLRQNMPGVVRGLQEELCGWSEAGSQRLGHTGLPSLWENLGLFLGPRQNWEPSQCLGPMMDMI